MRLAMIGLGKMGMNMTRRLIQGGHEVIAHDRSSALIKDAAGLGATPADSTEEVVSQLTPPRVVWLMVPSGEPTEASVATYCQRLSSGDLLIDGGNSRWTDSVRRHAQAKEEGIHFLDIGTSGGVWGLEVGYCLMAGGSREAFELVAPALKTLAPPNGYRLVGPVGAGHFAKMIHNGIEYGMMQAYAEGFELLRASGYDYDLAQVADLWNQGSVVRSWLLELAASAFGREHDLSSLRAYVDDSGEGRWTVIEAVERAVPAPVLTAALYSRFASRQDNSFAARVLAALRREFGGHAVRSAEE